LYHERKPLRRLHLPEEEPVTSGSLLDCTRIAVKISCTWFDSSRKVHRPRSQPKKTEGKAKSKLASSSASGPQQASNLQPLNISHPRSNIHDFFQRSRDTEVILVFRNQVTVVNPFSCQMAQDRKPGSHLGWFHKILLIGDKTQEETAYGRISHVFTTEVGQILRS